MLDWNDLRYFLAVARDGSTLAAARALRVSQTTVARRITALEEALGVRLFEKRQAGYTLTPEGQSLLGQAKTVESALNSFADAASAHSRDVSGTVKITTEEVYAITILAPLLRELHEAFPEIVIELDTSQSVRDLGAGEADISLRSTKAESQLSAGLVGRQLCIDDWALYCSRDYAARNGVPRNRAQLKKHSFIGGGGGNLWIHYQNWLQQLGLEQQVAMHHATSGGLLSGVRSGFGIAVLPCVVADGDPDLVQCLTPRSDHGRLLWLFTHERVRHTPRVRAVVDFLYDKLSKHVRKLEATRQAA
ncbi:LysR family transcriptional regulator [Sphingomonas sediminicola]|uniref:LysR family transcriptional regulator n=1 Tax=Sphingomonas sediminicola TaxID=386874 RepID=A0ABX6TFZ4_9SPHN|nr:LysR family transcriptional regulator [Sphingomonas sediminicola]QNP46518.1 LysR family transcriptional regulator [Sphingomonas sediminicola]